MKRRDFVGLAAVASAAISFPAFASGKTAVKPFAWSEATIDELQSAMTHGSQSAVSLAKAYIRRIREIDQSGPALNSVIEINPDAIAIARELDRERKTKGPRGPMHGIPVLIKDNIDTHDRMMTTAGSLALLGSIAPRDSFVTRKLRDAGAVIIGKTNLSEWANFRGNRSSSGWSGRGGQTKNPYALDRQPSGSSSGSAAAVAAGLCSVAVGTETDGSIISPSSFCGIVGIKPTVGLVSRSGIIPISHTQDTAGPMARTVRDAAILLSALAGEDPNDAVTAESRGKSSSDYTKFLDPDGLRGARIGVLPRYSRSEVARRIVEAAFETMKKAGATIVEIPRDVDLTNFGNAEQQVFLYEFKNGLNKYLASLGPNAPIHSLEEIIDFNERNKEKELAFFGQQTLVESQKKGPLNEKAYEEALAKCREFSREKGIDAVMNEHKLDALVAHSGGPAPLIDHLLGDRDGGGLTTPAAVAGYPSITVCAGDLRGMPVGICFFGRAYSEGPLLKLAYAFEQLTKARKPPAFQPSIGLGARMQNRFIAAAVILVAAGFAFNITAAQTELADRWWPIQSVPKTIIRVSAASEPVANHFAHEMMIQSVAGLAAKAVNHGKGDEMVWVETGNASMEEWFSRWHTAHENVTVTRATNSWALVDRFANQGLIKGYILYRQDTSRRDLNTYAPQMDCSVNVATSLAPILDAVIIDESLESEAIAHGLKRIEDARQKTQTWCFETYRVRFNRRMLCTQDPKKPHARDFAIAQNAFTVFGEGEPLNSIMHWLEPLSPILGWNGGDEFKTTELSSRYGHIQTATDWCMNLPVLMAGSENFEVKSTNAPAQNAIDWNDQRSAVAFVQSDGDNVQWLEGNFFHNPSYWSNPGRGRTPFGWSCCFSQLAQLCPSAIDFALATRSTNDSFLEWGGGYYYPDHFAQGRTNRWELLAQQAQRTWALMKKTNTRVIGFNVHKCDSADARKAYEVFAGETDALPGILVFQYYPYEGGAGETFWVKDRNGVDLPVVTTRYSIWENSNGRPRAGTPAKIACEIRDSTTAKPRYDWVISHAWSFFKNAPGQDENAENIPQNVPGGVRGYSPVTWCAERLPATVRVISPEELLLRIRMQHDADQTRSFLKRLD